MPPNLFFNNALHDDKALGPPGVLKLHGLTAGGPVGLNPRSHYEARSVVALSLGGLVMASVESREGD